MNNFFVNVLKSSGKYSELNSSIDKGMLPISITGPSGSAISNIIFSIGSNKAKQSLVITHNELEARKIYEDLKFFGGEKVFYFPSKEIVFFDVYAHSNQIIEERLKAIRTVLSGEECIVVTTIDSILLKLVPGKDWIGYEMPIKVGDIIDVSDFIERLVFMGYERVDMVQTKGQFSVRGGIIDFYSLIDDYPIRIELFDDEIDSIRTFDAVSQLSLEKIDNAMVKLTREMLFTENQIKKGIKKIKDEFDQYHKKIKEELRNNFSEKITELISKLDNKIYFDTIDNYIDYFIDRPETFFRLF